MFTLSRKHLLLLILGTIIFTTGFLPLLLVNNEMPTQTFKTDTEDGVQIIFDVTAKPDTTEKSPVAILLHGFSGNRKMMKLIAFSLADKGFVSVSVDLRGHGDSGGFMTNSSNFEKDVEAVIQALEKRKIGNTSEIVLIGHSMGGRVAIGVGSKLETVLATIGVAPAVSPEMVNTSTPRNLLLIISKGDTVIQNEEVTATFYKSINSTGEPGKVYDINGTKRLLFVDDKSNHLTILYQNAIMNEIVKWATGTVFDEEQLITINPGLIIVAVFTSVIGGLSIIAFAVVIVYDLFGIRGEKHENSYDSDWKNFLKVGIQAIVLAGIVGSLITAIVTIALIQISPLFLTNSIAAIFLGNAIVFAYFAKKALKGYKQELSYSKLIKQSLRKKSISEGIFLGIIVAIILLGLLYITVGNHLTLTFSTSSLRLLYLPLYIVIYGVVFLFYESFFKGILRPIIRNGFQMAFLSPILEFTVISLSVLLQFLLLGTILQQNIGLFLVGLNLIIGFLALTIILSDFFYKTTGGWIVQIIINAVLFATVSLVSSPISYLIQL